MKTAITRLFTYCVIGTSVLLTSCVSEDISPHVEELRSAQTDYLQAQAALEQAKAQTEAAQAALLQTQAQIAQAESDARIAMMAAETALMEAQVAFEEALMEAKTASEIARLEEEVAQAQYEKDLLEAKLAAEKAELEAMIAQAQVNAAQAQLALQEAVDALAGQINETAQEYLGLYQNTMEQANNKLNQIMSLQDVVARYDANLDVYGNVLDFEQVAADLEAAISIDMTEIEALQAAITRLEGLNVNADAVREELAQVENRIDELNSKLNDANLARDRAINAYEPFAAVWAEVNNRTSSIENYQNYIEQYQNVIANLEEDLAEVNERIAPYNEDIAEVLNSLEDEYQVLVSLTDAAEEAYYNLKYAQFNGTADEITDAQATYDTAKQEIMDYTGDYYGGPSAEYVYNSGTDMWEVVGYTYNSRIWLYANPVSGFEYGDAIIAVTDFTSNDTYNGLLSRINNLTNNLNNYNNAVINYNHNITSNRNRLSDIFADLEVSNAEGYYATYDQLYMDYIAKYEARNEIQAELDVQWDLRWDLYYYLNDPYRSAADFENQIADFQDQIENLEANIAANQELLVQNTFEAEEMAAMIARTQERIDRLMTEYDALVALANEYLEKFNEILENN